MRLQPTTQLLTVGYGQGQGWPAPQLLFYINHPKEGDMQGTLQGQSYTTPGNPSLYAKRRHF